MTTIYLVTLVLDLDGVAGPGAAARLLDEDAVVTVRIAAADAQSVVRVDVAAGDERHAAEVACELLTETARRLRWAMSIRSAHAVRDSERVGIVGHDEHHR